MIIPFRTSFKIAYNIKLKSVALAILNWDGGHFAIKLAEKFPSNKILKMVLGFSNCENKKKERYSDVQNLPKQEL